MERNCHSYFSASVKGEIHTLGGISYLIYSVLVALTNVLLITSFVATKQCALNTTNFLIVCLSISYLSIGMFLMPFSGFQIMWPNWANCSLKKACAIFNAGCSGINFSLTLLIAVDRYLHMDPEFHRSSSNLKRCLEKPRIYIVVAATVFVFILIACVQFALETGNTDTGIYTLLFTVFTIATLSISVAVYVRGYYRIRRHVAVNPVYAGGAEEPQYLKQLYKTVLMLLVTLTVSLLPISITICLAVVFNVMGRKDAYASELLTMLIISAFLYRLDAMANALIILYRNKECKEWIMEKMRKSFCKKITQEGSGNDVATINDRQAQIQAPQ